MKRILTIATIIAAVALCQPVRAQSNTPPPTSVSSNTVATTGPIAQVTGDVVGTIGTWIVQHGSAGVAYGIPISDQKKSSGPGPAATVSTWIYDIAWVSAGTTNIDSKLGLMNTTVFGRNVTVNQMGVEIDEALNTVGIANATAKIPVINFITKAAAAMNVDAMAGIAHNTDDMANGKFYERDIDCYVGLKVIKTF